MDTIKTLLSKDGNFQLKIVNDDCSRCEDYHDFFGYDEDDIIIQFENRSISFDKIRFSDSEIYYLRGELSEEEKKEAIEDGDFDEDKIKNIEENYKIDDFTVYEHGMYRFYNGKLRGWDYSNGGLILVKKDLNLDLEKFLEDLTSLYNGWIYTRELYKKHVFKDENGEELIQRDFEDACGGFLNVEDAYEDAIAYYDIQFEE